MRDYYHIFFFRSLIESMTIDCMITLGNSVRESIFFDFIPKKQILNSSIDMKEEFYFYI